VIFHLLLLILLLVASFLLQELTPGIVSLIEAATGGSEDFLHRARVLFLPAYCFTAALTVPFPLMLAIAFAGGILWDASHALIWGEGSPGFGSGPLLFGFFCAIMHGSGDFFLRRKWVFPILLGGVCVFFLLLAEYLWINFRAGDFGFPAGIWIKLCMSSLLTTLIMPVFLLVLDRSMRSHGLLDVEPGFGPR
jgi:hypothetical protein